jgi:hypothetical protein
MPTKVAVGVNKGPDSIVAGRDAAFEAKVSLQSDEFSLAIVFSSVGFDLEEVLHGVKRVIKNTPLIGTTGAGVISPAGSQKKAVAVMLISSSNIRCGLGAVGPIIIGKEKLSGQDLANQANLQTKGLKRHAFSLFCDNLINNPPLFISGIQEVLGVSFPIAGGFSADDGHLGKTYQFFNDQILSRSATGILWSGDCDTAVASGHGWKPLGRPLTVSEAKNNLLKKIEGKPAIKLYEDYFGDKVAELKNSRLSKIALLYPLGFYLGKEDGYVVKNVLSVEKDGSLLLQGEVPRGPYVRLMIGTKDSIISAAREAAKKVKEQMTKNSKKIKFAIISDSFSRFKLLGRSANREIEVIKEELGLDTPFIGFYSFGEQAPLSGLDYRGKSYILNESLNLLAVGE